MARQLLQFPLHVRQAQRAESSNIDEGAELLHPMTVVSPRVSGLAELESSILYGTVFTQPPPCSLNPAIFIEARAMCHGIDQLFIGLKIAHAGRGLRVRFLSSRPDLRHLLDK